MFRIDPRRARWLLAAALALPASTAPHAQPAKQASERPQEPIRVAIELVATAVTVRDRNGQFLSDLKPGEIEIYEDGVKQTLTMFSLSHGGRLFNLTPASTGPQPEGIILPRLHPAKDVSGRVFMIFVDDLHLDFAQTPRIRDLFASITKLLIHDGDLFAVVSTGPSSIAVDLTYDRKRLDVAKNKITGSGQRVRDILDAPSGAGAPPEVRHRAHVAFSTAHDLLVQFADLPDRRKSLIYISNGYDLNPFADEREKKERERDPDENPFRKQETFSDADLVSQLAELTRDARRANVAIYSIDPRGLIAGPDVSDPIDMAAYQKHVSKTQDTLRVLAEQTGGRPIVNKNDFDAALKLVDAETSNYYIVGYYANSAVATTRRRAIEIKVTRPNVDVTHRSEYSLKPRGK